VKFWDTSAIVPLIVREDATDAALACHEADPTVIVAWTTMVECASAIARAEHDRHLTQEEATGAFARLDALAQGWREVEPSDELREVARRLLRAHRLRAADAIPLAAATLAAERRPASLTVVTFDDRVETAALREGFTVLVPGRHAPAPGPNVPASSGDSA
jgi:predicted nucleic acid-binding protein